MSVGYHFSSLRVVGPRQRAEHVLGFILDTENVIEYAEAVRATRGAPRSGAWSWLRAYEGESPRGQDSHDPVPVLGCLRWLRDFSHLDHRKNRAFWSETEKQYWRPDGKHPDYSPELLAKRLARDLNGMIEICEAAAGNDQRVVLTCVL